MNLSSWLCDSSEFSFLVCLECKDCWRWFPNIFPCNSCPFPVLKDMNCCLALASFCCTLNLFGSFTTCWCFSKRASCARSSTRFTFYSIMSDWELAELFVFELLLEDLLEWLFVFDEAFEHLSSSVVSLNQECIFLLKLKTLSSALLSHLSLLLIFSSSRYCLHPSCGATTNFRISLNFVNSSSATTLFNLQYHHFSPKV